MNGSSYIGNVHILGHTYADCAVDHPGARIFYAASAVENPIVLGSDVSNAFGEAPAPKQGACLHPDRAFYNWWTYHKKRNSIPPGYIILVQCTMQGQPEPPCIWEKHIDSILRKIGLIPTVDEPCFYTMALLMANKSYSSTKLMTLLAQPPTKVSGYSLGHD